MAKASKIMRKRARQPHRRPGGPVFLNEWMVALNVSDDDLAKRMRVRRETVWRWQDAPNRLNPQKIAQIAEALMIEPIDLWRHPDRISLDKAARHIKDSKSLERLARYIGDLPPSGA